MHTKKQQRGGTILGFILGLVIGLGVALGVAIYVTKVPVPFLSGKEPSMRAYESSEAERNRNWDPNSPLYGKSPVAPQPPSGTASGAIQPAPAPAPTAPIAAPSADPLGDLASAQLQAAEAKAAATATAHAAPTPSSPAPAAESTGFNYFVQAGAFRNQAEADAQRAKLAMMGWEARVSEREQNGRPVFRVRVGPFDKRGDAEQLKQRLDGAGVDSALVRVQQ